MAGRHGRCRRGERLRRRAAWALEDHHPFDFAQTGFVACLRCSGMVAPMVLGGSINWDAFVAYVRQVLVPDLSPRDIVIMDNFQRSKSTRKTSSLS